MVLRCESCRVTAALLCVWLASTPTDAALTTILDSPDIHNEPNLLGVNPYPGNPSVSVLETLYGESNLRRVDDDLDVYFVYTEAVATAKMVAKFSGVTDRFGYLRSDGVLQGVLRAQDRRGSGYMPETFSPLGVLDPAETGPVFLMGMRDGPASSLPSANLTGADQMVTFEIVGVVGHPDNVVGNYVLAFEDTPPNYGTTTYDGDFQDLVVEVSGVVPVPEPFAPALLFAAALALNVFWRGGRRQG